MNESTDKPAASRARSRASNLKQRVKQDGKERIESGKRAAAEQIEELADAIDAAGSQLDQSQPTLANYASKLADGVGGLATRLREDSLEDIYRDVRRVATQHPGWFLFGSAAFGVLIARFMKASAEQSLENVASGGGAAELGAESRAEDEQDWGDRPRSSSDLPDGSLYGEGEGTRSASEADDEEDVETLRPGRESSASTPYSSPNLGA